jgi:sporulation related protein
MARSNGPYGPSGAPLRRLPGDDPFGTPAAQPAGQWPPAAYPDPASQPAPGGYPFPPQAQDPGYGYNNQPLLAAQQWGPPGGAQAYELNYQAYAGAEPSPFHQPAQHQQHQQQDYAEPDQDYNDEFFEDEEPRRGRRWALIAIALVGAIGVGGALAYTYRSLIAPYAGRVPLVKADPNVKVKPENRGGKDFASSDRKLPVRVPEEAARASEPAAGQEAPSENPGPRVVKSIPIAPPGGIAPSSPQAATAPSVPGITLYQPPQRPQAQQQQQQPQEQAAAPPPVQPAAAAAPKVVPAPPPGRIVVGAAPGATDDDPSQGATPPLKRAPGQSLGVPAPRPTPTKASSAGGAMGYVAVLSSQKSSMDALKLYADMREKYPAVLGDKTPDVQEADLSARGLGTMYRLVVGPPGSHNAASGVCAQLKTAGYEGCWVKEY